MTNCIVCETRNLDETPGTVVMVAGSLETMTTAGYFYCEVHAEEIGKAYRDGQLYIGEVRVRADMILTEAW